MYYYTIIEFLTGQTGDMYDINIEEYGNEVLETVDSDLCEDQI